MVAGSDWSFERMSFSFYNPTKHKMSDPLHSEAISIGCEAWIDVSRFCRTEKSSPQSGRIHNNSEDDFYSTLSQTSITKSFADICSKFRRVSEEQCD